jgi:predicted PP-loop superfamily ATPase
MTLKFDWFVSQPTATVSALFSLFSNLDNIDKAAKSCYVDSKASKLVDVLCKGLGREIDVNYIDVEHEICDARRTNDVVVAFSGGKDSVATVLKLKSQGKTPHLFHVVGINKSYPDEIKHAKELAAKLGLELHIERVSQIGNTSFKESPIKNQVIASMALDYAIANGIGGSVAFGDFTTDNINNSQFYES